MVKLAKHPTFTLAPAWRITYRSALATAAVDGTYRLLIARQSAAGPAHFLDGRLSCYLTHYHRTEHLEGGLTGRHVSGYLNLQAIDGYALSYHDGDRHWMALITPTPGNTASLADLRRQAMTVARQLGWMPEEG